MFVRRRPLLRAAVVGGGAYVAGKRAAQRQAGMGSMDQGSVDQGQGQGMSQPSASGAQSVSDQLAQLSSLHEQGSLSDSEFAAAKASLLGS